MHRVFGKKENAEYVDRPGAYLIAIRDGCVGVVRTKKGYFFPGGGRNKGESDGECVRRECMEETGYTVSVGRKVCSAETYCVHPEIGYFHPVQAYYAGEFAQKAAEAAEEDHEFMYVRYEELKGKMFSDMQNWALDMAWAEHAGRD